MVPDVRNQIHFELLPEAEMAAIAAVVISKIVGFIFHRVPPTASPPARAGRWSWLSAALSAGSGRGSDPVFRWRVQAAQTRAVPRPTPLPEGELIRPGAPYLRRLSGYL